MLYGSGEETVYESQLDLELFRTVTTLYSSFGVNLNHHRCDRNQFILFVASVCCEHIDTNDLLKLICYFVCREHMGDGVSLLSLLLPNVHEYCACIDYIATDAAFPFVAFIHE